MSRFNRRFFVLMMPSYFMGCIVGYYAPMPWPRVLLLGVIFGILTNLLSALYDHLEKKEAAK